MQSDKLKRKVKDLEVTGATHNRIQEVSFQILQDGSDGEWQHVANALKELAYCCAKCGLNMTEFLKIRKELIQVIEQYKPLAKTEIELAERTKHEQIIH